MDKMAKRKRTPVTTSQQEQFLQDFNDHLDNESFLGHSFEDEDDSYVDFVISSDESGVNDDSVEVDTPAMDLDDNSAEENIAETAEALTDNTQRKQKFSNIDDVLNLDNYNLLRPQKHAKYHYSDKKGTFVIDWETTRVENPRHSGRLPTCNIIRKKPGPKRTTSSFKSLD